MTGYAGSRADLVRALMLAAAVAVAALPAPLAASAAVDGTLIAASQRSMDAAAEATLYVGVRQAAVGDPVPVTVVGGAEGAVWEISLVSPETALGTVTIGADGTGTTLVALPVGTSAGSLELAASTAGAEISTVLSSAGAAPDSGAEPEAPAPEAARGHRRPRGRHPVGCPHRLRRGAGRRGRERRRARGAPPGDPMSVAAPNAAPRRPRSMTCTTTARAGIAPRTQHTDVAAPARSRGMRTKWF